MFNPEAQWLKDRRAKQAACLHENVQEDRFSKITGVRRSTPGDVVCADCGALLPYVWNNGKPKPIEDMK
jgi:hypothetical protein